MKGDLQMFGWFFTLIKWVSSIWAGLPDDLKDKIIGVIVETFDDLFRAYYRSQKDSGEKNA